MSGGRPVRERRERLTVDRSSLPDPSAWAGASGRGHGAAVARIVLAAGALVAGVACVALGMRSSTGRLAAVRAALPAAGALPAGAGDPAPPGDDAPAARPMTPERLADLQRSWAGSETIAPRDARVDHVTGERSTPFHGFGVSVETSPPGARVVVDGAELGTTPLVASVACAAGDRVEVVAERGALGGRVATRCRPDALVELRIPLRRR